MNRIGSLVFALLLGLSLVHCGTPSGQAPAAEALPDSGETIPLIADPARQPAKKVNLRGVVKTAVPLRRDYPVQLTVPDRASSLRFALGVLPGPADRPVRFTIRQGQTLLQESVLDPKSTEGWREVTVAAAPGSSITIASDLKGDGAWLAHPRPLIKNDPRPWVVFILVDAMRADSLGTYGAQGDPSPNFDALARKGAVFTNAHTSSPFTLTSVASIFTALYPWQHRVLFSKEGSLVLSDKVPSLIERFRAAGYHTAAFSGTYFRFSQNGFARGFDTFDETCETSFFRDSAECLNQRLAQWVPQHADEPVFLYLHYVDTHTPYYPPEPFRSRFTRDLPEPFFTDVKLGRVDQYSATRPWYWFWRRPSAVDLAWLRGLYQGEVAYADSKAGRLIDQVKRARGQGGVIWLVTADHGEAFYEHGVMEHVAELHEPVMRVPFILAGPGVPRGKRIDDQVRTIDYLPTLLDLAGIEPPAGTPGVSLTPLWKGGKTAPRPAAALHYLNYDPEYAFIAWPWKLFYRPDGGVNLYDLEKDPDEMSDLASTRSDRVDQMMALARALLALPAPEGADSEPVNLQTWKALEELGYLPGGSRRPGTP